MQTIQLPVGGTIKPIIEEIKNCFVQYNYDYENQKVFQNNEIVKQIHECFLSKDSLLNQKGVDLLHDIQIIKGNAKPISVKSIQDDIDNQVTNANITALQRFNMEFANLMNYKDNQRTDFYLFGTKE